MNRINIAALGLSGRFAALTFGDCTHTAEPGCAIRKAIEDGKLSENRFESYEKLQRELSYSGLNARQLENEKINRMFGGKAEIKRIKEQSRR